MFIPEKIKIIFPAFLLLIICLLAYAPLLNHHFMLDDVIFFRFHDITQILKNPQLIFPHSSHHVEPLYHLSNAILFSLLKKASALYAINIVLFYINNYLLFILIFLFTKNYFIALLTSVLFCLHPMNADIIMHISFNNILFCTALMELSLITLYKHTEQNKHLLFYVLSLGFYSIALLFQEISIFFPLYAASFLFYKNANIKQTLRLCLPFIALSCGLLILWFYSGGSRIQLLDRVSALNMTAWALTANFFILIKWYVSNLIYPTDIVFMFNMLPTRDHLWIWNLFFFSFTVGIPTLIFLRLKKTIEGLALSLFLIGFLFMIPGSIFRPYMGLVIEPYWFYFSSIGFFLLVASLIQKMKTHTNKYLYMLLLFSILTFLFTHTQRQIPLGENQIIYCANWLNKSPNNTIALEGLERLLALDENIEIPESLVPQMFHLIDWYLLQHRNPEAIRLIERILHLKKPPLENRTLNYQLAVAYYKNKDIDRSEAIINNVIRKGSNPNDLFELSMTFYKNGLTKQAIQLLQQCQSLYPLYTEAYLQLGIILTKEQQYTESISWLKKGASLAPSDTRFIENIRKASLLQKN